MDRPHRRGGVKTIVGPLLLVVVGIIGGLLMLEGAIRLLRIQGDNAIQPDRNLGWSHIPGVSGHYVSPQARCRFHINSLGMMGPERSEEKRPGTRRVLLLGDSFTESMQVPFEESWAGLLQRQLGADWEVLNAGVSGYGTDTALLYLTTRGFRYRPDIVFLMFFTGNDVSDNDHTLSRRIGENLPKPYFTLEGESLRVHNFPLPAVDHGIKASIKGFLKRHSLLYLFVRDRVNRFNIPRRQASRDGAPAPVPLTWRVYERKADADWSRAWAVTRSLLRRINDETGARGIPLAVGILPTGWRIDRGELDKFLGRYPAMRDSARWHFSGPDRRLSAILLNEGVPFVDLTPPLVEAAKADPTPLYGNHLSRRGHAVVAQAVARLIKTVVASGSLPGR